MKTFPRLIDRQILSCHRATLATTCTCVAMLYITECTTVCLRLLVFEFQSSDQTPYLLSAAFVNSRPTVSHFIKWPLLWLRPSGPGFRKCHVATCAGIEKKKGGGEGSEKKSARKVCCLLAPPNRTLSAKPKPGAGKVNHIYRQTFRVDCHAGPIRV